MWLFSGLFYFLSFDSAREDQAGLNFFLHRSRLAAPWVVLHRFEVMAVARESYFANMIPNSQKILKFDLITLKYKRLLMSGRTKQSVFHEFLSKLEFIGVRVLPEIDFGRFSFSNRQTKYPHCELRSEHAVAR